MNDKIIDSLVNGINIQDSRPTNPIVGDAYYDTRHECISIYDGVNWALIGTSTIQEKIRKRKDKIDELLKK